MEKIKAKKMVVKTMCSVKKKPFAIVFVQRDNNAWEAQDSFKLSEERAKKGFGQGALEGDILTGVDFRGCPYCEDDSFFLCSCNTLNCLGAKEVKEGKDINAYCGNCNSWGYLADNIEKLNAFGDL